MQVDGAERGSGGSIREEFGQARGEPALDLLDALHPLHERIVRRGEAVALGEHEVDGQVGDVGAPAADLLEQREEVTQHRELRFGLAAGGGVERENDRVRFEHRAGQAAVAWVERALAGKVRRREPAVAIEQRDRERPAILRLELDRIRDDLLGGGRQRLGVRAVTQRGQLAARIGELAVQHRRLRAGRPHERAEQGGFARAGQAEQQQAQAVHSFLTRDGIW